MSILSPARAAELLKQGEVVAIPTETVYGLAGRIDFDGTLRRIFTVKQRPFFDPLIVHVETTEQARALALQWPSIFDDLTAAFWPGPLTLVTAKTAAVSSLITSGLETVALRCPRHPMALEILREVGVPLAAPSANRFGRTSPTTAAHVVEEFADLVPVVDGGACSVGVESTVLQVEARPDGGWRLNILRPGGVSRAHLEAALTPKKYRIEFARVHSEASPGHLKTHYQPANAVVIADTGISDAELLTRLAPSLQVNIFRLQLPARPEQAARVLYSEFRRLSHTPGLILVEASAHNSGPEWEAIWDRIERAATSDFRLKP